MQTLSERLTTAKVHPTLVKFTVSQVLQTMPPRTISGDEPHVPFSRLLAALPVSEHEILPRFEQVTLTRNQVLYEAGSDIPYVLFPHTGLISLMDHFDGPEAAVGGSRSFLGLPLALGSRISPYQAVVQVPGSATRMQADDFLNAFEHRFAFNELIMKYIQLQLMIISQSSACNGVHSFQQRTARALLTLADQVMQFAFPIATLKRTLAVSHVELARTLDEFRDTGFISDDGTMIRVRDPKRLQLASCECFSEMTTVFERFFPRAQCSSVLRRQLNPRRTSIRM